ncbi:MAG: hypothetical protein A4E61_00162 [Syntrophorhabdus sp. PtaB.Bin184]|nr:MAG: hypothetical protein A4E61_00162 [Syntrophorhabdus sp. PtaB.Bin184]
MVSRVLFLPGEPSHVVGVDGDVLVLVLDAGLYGRRFPGRRGPAGEEDVLGLAQVFGRDLALELSFDVDALDDARVVIENLARDRLAFPQGIGDRYLMEELLCPDAFARGVPHEFLLRHPPGFSPGLLRGFLSWLVEARIILEDAVRYVLTLLEGLVEKFAVLLCEVYFRALELVSLELNVVVDAPAAVLFPRHLPGFFRLFRLPFQWLCPVYPVFLEDTPGSMRSFVVLQAIGSGV